MERSRCLFPSESGVEAKRIPIPIRVPPRSAIAFVGFTHQWLLHNCFKSEKSVRLAVQSNFVITSKKQPDKDLCSGGTDNLFRRKW